MPFPNIFYIGWATEVFLSAQHTHTKPHLLKALRHSREHSPCGLVFDLALAAGAETERATVAGSAVELLYACASLCDDIQDGEGEYVSEEGADQVGTMLQLYCYGTQRLHEIDEQLSKNFAVSGVLALEGQYMERDRVGWNREKYLDVAARIAGFMYGEYFRVAAHAAGVDSPLAYVDLGRKVGELLQVCVDFEHKDERLLGLPDLPEVVFWAEQRWDEIRTIVGGEKNFGPMGEYLELLDVRRFAVDLARVEKCQSMG